MVEQITTATLKQWQLQQKPFVLLDVREPAERASDHLGGLFIPMDEVLKRISELPTQIPLVVYCHKGIRSAIVIQRLQQKTALTNLYNLQGGIAAWRRQSGEAE